jgi:O-antigen/teichoic acid export membrane protein
MGYMLILIQKAKAHSHLLGKAGMYALSSILNKSVPFLLLPVLTHYLSPADYGIVSVFSVLVLALMPIIGLSSNTILLQRYFKSTSAERQELLASSYVVMILVTTLLVLTTLVISSWLTSLLKLPKLWLLLAVLASFSGMVFTMSSTLMQIRQQVVRFGTTQFIQTLINTGLSLVFVVALGYGWEGRISGIIIASAIAMIYAIIYNIRSGDFKFGMISRPTELRYIVKNGALLLPISLAGVGMAMSDRFLLAPMVSMTELGIYSVALMMCQLMVVMFGAISMGFAPFFFEKYNGECAETRRKVVSSAYAISFLYLLLAFTFVLISPYIVKLMLNERYHSATGYIAWLAFGYAIMESGGLFHNHMVAAERNKVLMWISFAMLAVSLAANYVLIKLNGTIGAAQALLVSASFFLAINLYFSRRHNKAPLRLDSGL